MKTYSVTLPLIGLVAGTRALGGAGVALLAADKLTSEQRRAVGWTLLGLGLLTTPALMALVFSGGTGGTGEGKRP